MRTSWPRLEYGDAIAKANGKYATDFIILCLADIAKMKKRFLPIVADIADYFETLFAKAAEDVKKIGFYGSDRDMSRLGYIALPVVLRQKISAIKNGLPDMTNGPYPPRKDGGYGWFIVQKSADEAEEIGEYSTGCNIAGDDQNYAGSTKGHIYYMWISEYFANNVYVGGTRWLCANNIPQCCENGAVPAGALSEDDIIRLLQANLIKKTDVYYCLNFAAFTKARFEEFRSLLCEKNETLNKMLTELILDIKQAFNSFVPKRLENQINQWVSCLVSDIIGNVAQELISRDVLIKPDEEKPLTDGVFYVEGDYINA